METKKINGIIHGIIAIVFSIGMILVWPKKDFGFWCFLVSVLLIILNSFLIGKYIEKNHEKQAGIMEQAFYVIPVGTLIGIILITVFLPKLTNYNCNIFLTVHIVIFAVSIILQLLLFHGRKYNLNQEINIEEKRWSKEDTAYQWVKIAQALVEYSEAKHYASKIENEIRYSDPISSGVLAELEENITKLTNDVAILSLSKEKNIDNIVELEKQVLDLIDERNDKCKRLK